jgi:CheY-like chemotaxis protein
MELRETNVLVVDDEPALREIFAKWLRVAGCLNVLTAANGQEAFEILSHSKIDVLITDVRMPVMDGITLVRKLAAIEHRIACIIFVSGFGEVDLREMYDLGVEAFLAKPFRIEDLSQALANAVADRDTLWKNPLSPPPRQTLTLRPDPPTEQNSEPGVNFRLGRGGFSARSNDAVSLGKVTFDCPTSSQHPALTGEGYVRWRSKVDLTIGVEFGFLEQPGRDWVVATIEEEDPRSFIPSR